MCSRTGVRQSVWGLAAVCSIWMGKMRTRDSIHWSVEADYGHEKRKSRAMQGWEMLW